MSAVLMLATRKAFAASVKAADIFCAFGPGFEAWENTPPAPPNTLLDIYSEIGRKKVLFKEYCVPSSNGTIIGASGQKYAISNVPTHHLYLKVTLEPDELTSNTFREIGWFWGGTLVNPGAHVGELLFVPSGVDSKGTLLVVARRAPVIRGTDVRHTFHNVVTF